MKSLTALAFVVVFAISGPSALAQSGLGKKKEQGKQEQKQEQGKSQGGGSGLGKSQGGGGTSGGGSTGRGNGGGGDVGRGQGGSGGSSSGLGKSQGGGTSGGSSAGRGNGGGDTGRGQGGSGGSSSGLGKGRGDGGGSTSSGGTGRSQGGGTSSGGDLGRSQGGGTSGNGGYGRSQGGGTSGSGDLGRINSDRLDRTNSIGKGSDQGRSGGSGYGSNNNRGRGDGAFRIESPQLNLNKGSLPSQVFRTETVRVNSRWRDGYSGYSDNWRDDNFYYPYYAFSPWGHSRDCTVSPWYYYSNLPGYIWSNRIFYYSSTSCDWGIGSSYQWNRGNNYNTWGNYRSNNELDEAIEDIVRVFERSDRRSLDRLVPSRGRVNIYMDSVYCYSLDAADFYDLMLDNVRSTRTSRYSIDRVTTHRDSAQVAASHEYVDPWGRRQYVYHNYRLEQDRYGYIITDFRSSARR